MKLRWGTFLGAVSIALSMCIYQSYFGAAALMVGALLFKMLNSGRSFRELFFQGLRLFATLAAAIALYMVVVRIISHRVPLIDYIGIDFMGKISLREILGQI